MTPEDTKGLSLGGWVHVDGRMIPDVRISFRKTGARWAAKNHEANGGFLKSGYPKLAGWFIYTGKSFENG